MPEEKKITFYEADIYEKVEPKEETRQFVVFRISSEWYALEILKVRGITKIDRITYLPSTPSYIAGIVNLRGNILSVTDLKTIFGLAPLEILNKDVSNEASLKNKAEHGIARNVDLRPVKAGLSLTGLAPGELTHSTVLSVNPERVKRVEGLTEKSRLIVIESGLLETGLMVDEVVGVEDVVVSKIDPTLTTLPPERADYLEGEFRIEDKLVGILRVEKILARGGLTG